MTSVGTVGTWFARPGLVPWMLGLVLLCVGGVEAQTVRGIVRDRVTGQPIQGVLVILSGDSTGPAIRTLTGPAGRYSLTAAAGGTFRLFLDRIGFERVSIDDFVLTAGQALRRDLEVEPRPISLRGLAVEGATRRCVARPESAAETALLWSEARKALEAAEVTARGGLRFRVRARRRTLAPRSLAVLEEWSEERSLVAKYPVRSRPASELADEGYLRTDADGWMTFFAPDASVLLSDDFLDTHCFDIEPGDGADGMVGLRFSPMGGRRVPDIEGVFWLSTATARLAKVNFTYTGLPWRFRSDDLGGEVSFEELPDGRWIVPAWYIRAPVVSVRRSAGPGGTVSREMLTSILEEGAEVLQASGRGLTWFSQVQTGRVSGVVWDSIVGGPLEGASVTLIGTAHQASTDTGGNFTFDGLPEGRYRVTFSHARTDSLELELGYSEVTVVAGASEHVTMAIPSAATMLALACGEDGRGVLVGLVRWEDTGDAIPDATVTAVPVGGEGVGQSHIVATGADGEYRFCDLPSSSQFRVVARRGSRLSSLRTITASPAGYSHADLVITATAAERITPDPSVPPIRPILLDSLLVEVEGRSQRLDMVGFYRREKTEGGTFLGPEILENRRSRRISDLFRTLPGIRVVESGEVGFGAYPVTAYSLRTRIDPNRGCWPRIYVDGILVEQGGNNKPLGEFDSLVRADDIEGIEVYSSPAEIPVEYGGASGAGCGVYLIWTKG